MQNATRVEYVSNGHLTSGYVIDQMESPLTGKYRLLVADRPGDDPTVDGKWIDAIDCEECDPRYYRNGQHLSQFI